MKLPYKEGTFFLVPLGTGGYARGVIARAGRKGKVLVGYFFRPRIESKEIARSDDLKPEGADLVARFGDLGLIKGTWPIIGTVPNWHRSKWPMPDFVRRELLTDRIWLVRFSDDDPVRIEKEVQIDSSLHLPAASLYGAEALEIELSKLLT
jgi:hypothetical protein